MYAGLLTTLGTYGNGGIVASSTKANYEGTPNQTTLNGNTLAASLVALGINPAAIPVSAGVYVVLPNGTWNVSSIVTSGANSIATLNTVFTAGENPDGFYETTTYTGPAGDTVWSLYAGPSVALVLPTTRGSHLKGIRIVPVQSGGSLAAAYDGCVLTTQQDTSNPFAGQYQTAQVIDEIPIIDDSVYALCSPLTMALSGPPGQAYNVYIMEGQAEDIYPGEWATINGGGGGNPSGNVASTGQTTAVGYAPTLSTDGASIASAKGARIYLDPLGGTWQDGASLTLERYLGDAVWVSVPGVLFVPPGSTALGAGALIGLSDLGFTVGANERLFVGANSGAVTGGGGSIVTSYEIQS